MKKVFRMFSAVTFTQEGKAKAHFQLVHGQKRCKLSVWLTVEITTEKSATAHLEAEFTVLHGDPATGKGYTLTAELVEPNVLRPRKANLVIMTEDMHAGFFVLQLTHNGTMRISTQLPSSMKQDEVKEEEQLEIVSA
jgi:hypothetical protein